MRWGILGTGFAARQFTIGLRSLPEATVTAVASQSADRAERFAKQFSIEQSYADYQQLINQANVDVVYIGTVAAMHHRLCLSCIDNGKPVLCEKPFAMNARQATEVADAARRQGVFCMEAMWSRFIPMMKRVRTVVQSGRLGDIRAVSADFGLRQTPESAPRLFHPDSGGALLDLAVYPVSLAVEYMGEPQHVKWECVSAEHKQGVINERASGLLSYRSGAIASVSADIRCQTPTVATIVGTHGYILIESPMYRPVRATLTYTRQPRIGSSSKSTSGAQATVRRIASGLKRRLIPNSKVIRCPYTGNGYQYQAQEVMDCLRRGLIESPIMPLDQSSEVLRVLDAANPSTCVSQVKPQSQRGHRSGALDRKSQTSLSLRATP